MATTKDTKFLSSLELASLNSPNSCHMKTKAPAMRDKEAVDVYAQRKDRKL